MQETKRNFEGQCRGSVLVTGGCGYIGSNLCVDLIRRGYEIIIADDLANGNFYCVDLIEKSTNSKIKFYNGSLCDKDFVKKVFAENNISGIVHLAAKKYVDESVLYPSLYLHNNVDSTRNILEFAKKYGVKKICFASSITVYGQPQTEFLSENHPLCPTSPYAKSKVICECYMKKFAKDCSDSTVTVFRFSNPVGADDKIMLGDDPQSGKKNLLPYLVGKILKNETVSFNGNSHKTADGTTARDYIHIKDLTNIVAKIFSNNNKAGMTVYNIANGQLSTGLMMAKEIARQTNSSLKVAYNPPRENDPDYIACDVSKIKNEFNYMPQYNMKDIVSSFIAFSKNKQAERTME